MCSILYFKIPSVCPSVSATVSASINPLPSDRLRCCDRYIWCHRLLTVKPLSPREHAGRRVGKGRTLGSVQTERHPIPWSRVTVAARTGQWSWVDIPFSKSNNYNNTAYKDRAMPHRPTQDYTVQELNEMSNLK